MNYKILIGMTIEEANEFLKNLGYFVTDIDEQLHYENSVQVVLEDGKIKEVIRRER